jgi:beta-galactosidase GanA
MRIRNRYSYALLFAALSAGVASGQAPTAGAGSGSLPHLEKRGSVTQLIVDGKPFLILGAELRNSSSSSLTYMAPIWPKLKEIPLNTVLTPLSWELIEPREGQFDFSLVDGLLKQAREQQLKIVFLWLASWKNGMSSYAPVWVKDNPARFPRVLERGQPVEVLSTFGAETLKADSKAFAALMRHIKEVDSADHTVLMMQVENEVGVLGASRDRSPAANSAFASAVPTDLMRYLQAHRDTLFGDLRDRWLANGGHMTGTWEQVFGVSTRTDEIFMAWNYARYVNTVAAAGKAEYSIPMYTNTWLASSEADPGDYPSGGPQAWVIDVWKAAGNAIDFVSPDIYAPNFTEFCRLYSRPDNPLFIPEMQNAEGASAGNLFYAIGESAAIGVSPFGTDDGSDTKNELGKSYAPLMQLMPILLDAQAKGNVHGFVVNQGGYSSRTFIMQGIEVKVSPDEIFGTRAQQGYGLIIHTGKNGQTGPDEFIGVGKGFRVSFASRNGEQIGIAAVDEGHYESGQWVAGRRLNGDENDQGKYWRFSPDTVRIEKATVYRFR